MPPEISLSARRLSEGALIRASVEGRVLGMHVLALDATIVAVPAAPDGPRPASPRPPSRPPALTGPRPWRGAPGRGELRLIGGSLARAERFLDEGRTSLADVELVRCRRR